MAEILGVARKEEMYETPMLIICGLGPRKPGKDSFVDIPGVRFKPGVTQKQDATFENVESYNIVTQGKAVFEGIKGILGKYRLGLKDLNKLTAFALNEDDVIRVRTFIEPMFSHKHNPSIPSEASYSIGYRMIDRLPTPIHFEVSAMAKIQDATDVKIGKGTLFPDIAPPVAPYSHTRATTGNHVIYTINPMQGERFEEQQELVFKALADTLNADGLRNSAVADVQATLNSMEYFSLFNDKWKQVFPNNAPTRTTIAAQKVLKFVPDQKIQLKVTVDGGL